MRGAWCVVRFDTHHAPRTTHLNLRHDNGIDHMDRAVFCFYVGDDDAYAVDEGDFVDIFDRDRLTESGAEGGYGFKTLGVEVALGHVVQDELTDGGFISHEGIKCACGEGVEGGVGGGIDGLRK